MQGLGLGSFQKSVSTPISNSANRQFVHVIRQEIGEYVVLYRKWTKKKISWAVFKKEIQLNLISVSMLDKTLNCMLCHVLQDLRMSNLCYDCASWRRRRKNEKHEKNTVHISPAQIDMHPSDE